MEMDIFEANGGFDLSTSWHTWFNWDGGCDRGGCVSHIMNIGGQFHVRAEFGLDGGMHTYFNGTEIGRFRPSPSDNERNSVRDTMNSRGVVFSSSQWTVCEPGPGDVKGDLDNSQFSIRNVIVSGSVVMGPEPPKCTGFSSPSPLPSPSPSPTPSPPTCDCSSPGCGLDDGSFCFRQCCSNDLANSTEMSV